MTDEDIIRQLVSTVAKLEERDAAMDKRIDAFQAEMQGIATSLQAVTKTLNAIRNVLIMSVLLAISNGGAIPKELLILLRGVFGG